MSSGGSSEGALPSTPPAPAPPPFLHPPITPSSSYTGHGSAAMEIAQMHFHQHPLPTPPGDGLVATLGARTFEAVGEKSGYGRGGWEDKDDDEEDELEQDDGHIQGDLYGYSRPAFEATRPFPGDEEMPETQAQGAQEEDEDIDAEYEESGCEEDEGAALQVSPMGTTISLPYGYTLQAYDPSHAMADGFLDEEEQETVNEYMAHELDQQMLDAQSAPGYYPVDEDDGDDEDEDADADMEESQNAGVAGGPGAMYEFHSHWDMDDTSNGDFYGFVQQWAWRFAQAGAVFPMRHERLDQHLGEADGDPRRRPVITREDLDGDRCDFQGLDWQALCDVPGLAFNWEQLGTARNVGRKLRDRLYRNYTNLSHQEGGCVGVHAHHLPNTANYYRFRQFDTTNRPRWAHFQLRNLLAATSAHDVFYAAGSKIYHMDPTVLPSSGGHPSSPRVALDVPGTTISTMTASDGVLIAGGFNGEYALKSLHGSPGARPAEGILTTSSNPITNQVHTFVPRSAAAPHAVFASNDDTIRVLDCGTNTLVAAHTYPWPVNCTATSPDGRLRVLVGDDLAVLIAHADDGRPYLSLPGHADYGFAAAWSPDGALVATGNQDKQVLVWDVRQWRAPLWQMTVPPSSPSSSSSFSSPYPHPPYPPTAIAASLGGVRALRFSPLGTPGGGRLLAAAEPCDHVSILDARRLQHQQSFDFFGDVGGLAFEPAAGDALFVGVCDARVGGVLVLERAGGVRDPDDEGWGWDEEDANHPRGQAEDEFPVDWLPDDELDADPRVKATRTARARQGLRLGGLIV